MYKYVYHLGTRSLYICCRLEEKWSAVKIPLNVPTFEELVSYQYEFPIPDGVSASL